MPAIAATPRFLDRHRPPHIATLVVMAALPALTMNLILPSLPRMALAYQVDYATMQLAVSLFLVTNALVQVVMGPLSDRFGRRPVMLAAMVAFLAGTLGALAAPTAGVFLAMRMLQAVAATGMVLSRAVVRDLYPAERAASMIGYVTMGMSLAPMIAPTVGGVLDQAFGWQAVLWFLLGLGTLATLLIWFDLGETATRRESSLGAQLRQYPQLLRSRRFWGYTMVSMFGSASFFAYLGGAPYVATVIHHLTPLQVGLGFGAPAVGYAAGNFIAGRYAARTGLNRMILWGGLVTAGGMAGLALLDLAGLASVGVFFAAMISVGLGSGMQLPNANAGLLSVRPELAGTASGLGGAITLGGGALAAWIAGLLLAGQTSALPLVLLMLGMAVCELLAWADLARQAKVAGAVPLR